MRNVVFSRVHGKRENTHFLGSYSGRTMSASLKDSLA